MSLATNLRKKGIMVTEFEYGGTNYRNQWIASFFESIHENIGYSHNFLWEFFPTAPIGYLEGKEANKSFDKVNKQFCYIFFQESNDVLKVEFASEMKAKDLLHESGEYSDVYVVDKGFNWTYVVPHEKGVYGPYFYRK